MSFKRLILPKKRLQGRELTDALVGIGVRLGGSVPASPPNIEDVLYSGSLEALESPDYRLLALLTDWLSIHAEAVNVDRLTRLVGSQSASLILTYWGAVGQWLMKDTRWKKLARYGSQDRVDLYDSGTDFLIARLGGEDERFAGTCLRVPKGTLRRRPGDILSPEELAARHRGYYYRLLIGPVYRSDMWSFLEQNPGAAAADIARATYGSFTSAWNVKRDFDCCARARALVRKSA